MIIRKWPLFQIQQHDKLREYYDLRQKAQVSWNLLSMHPNLNCPCPIESKPRNSLFTEFLIVSALMRENTARNAQLPDFAGT